MGTAKQIESSIEADRCRTAFILILFFAWTACSGPTTNEKGTDLVISDNSQSNDASASKMQGSTFVYGSPDHTELSKTFTFQSSIIRIYSDGYDSNIVTLVVKNKNTKAIVYIVRFATDFLLGDSTFMNANIRSYTTGKNKEAVIPDNDYGDIVVADFNFDSREDFAVKREVGGNGGPIYNYYLQTADASFELDKFLSDTMKWFPGDFNKTKKTLTTWVHASAVNLAETTYKLDPLTGKWSRYSFRLVRYDEYE